MNKVVARCLTGEDLLVIQDMSRSADVEVIAVALDLGNGPALRELHDAAVAAGAKRCHALDVREEFARACVLPVVEADTVAAAMDELETRARDFVTSKVLSIATLEGEAEVVSPSAVSSPAADPGPCPAPPDRPANVRIRFEDGVPAALNDIPMSPAELLDCLGTIGAAHGLGRAEAGLGTLHASHRALASDSRRTGSVCLSIWQGGITVVQPEYATT